jgi:hypothetical protein
MQIATELRRRYPDLMRHIEGLGIPVVYGFPLDCGPRRFPIALPTLKVLVDPDARLRGRNKYWPLAYKLARQEGWEIFDDQQAMNINAPLSAPGESGHPTGHGKPPTEGS